MKKTFLFATVFLFAFYILNAQDLPKGLTPAECDIMPFYQPPTSQKSMAYPPASAVRAMAEWEELEAISVTWRSYQSVLAEIIRHAQNECKVLINCTDSNTVKNYLVSKGITPNQNVKYIITASNSVWIRDYGSYSVYKEDVDSLYLIDWIYNRPRPLDDVIPSVHAEYLNLPLYAMTQNPYRLTHTGGNLMFDGFGSAFSSKLILDENIQYSHTESEIDTIMKSFMGVDKYVKFEVLPHDGIHHIDMHMKLLDEETLLVGEYPSGISDGPQIEANLLYLLNNHLSVFGTPYKIVRIPLLPNQAGNSWPSNGSYYRTYTNGVFINKSFIYPSYYEKYDTTAFRIYSEALPGYNIVPINCDPDPISASGAIHCITNNIGVKEPLLISHKALSDTHDDQNDYTVNAIIRHISGIASAQLFYTTDTNQAYLAVPMVLSDVQNHIWTAAIPAQVAGNNVFYYIHAEANSGKNINRPITAPHGYWRFKILNTTGISMENVFVDRIFPNPASAITCIEMHIIRPESTSVALFDIQGKKVLDVYNGILNEGMQRLFFNAKELQQGVYFVKIETKSGISVHRIVAMS